MIPFIIKESTPEQSIDDVILYDNVTVNLCISQNIDQLDETIIQNIVLLMYDFYVYEYSSDDKITSYADFCEKYKMTRKEYVYGWDNPYKVYYFNNKWIEWSTTKYVNEIFKAFQECVARYEERNNVDLTNTKC
jgi:hypothetical protein